MSDGGSGRAQSRGPWRALIVGLVALAAIGAGLFWIFSDKSEVSTDDAYVQADRTVVSPKVHGQITEVLVQENAPVKVGDPLVKLDPEEYQVQVTAAQGDLMAANAAALAARAGLSRLDAEEKLATSQVDTAEKIAGPKAASDPAVAAAFETARGQALVAARSRGEIQAALAQADAAQFRARTQLGGARRLEGYTTVVAQADGVATDVQAAPGAFVQPGVTLMNIVHTGAPYVTANFKETQTGRMIAGQTARVRIDALPGRVFTGKVQSLAPGSGSEFALLPFEPGSGNFTKIVQRVPVRIALDPGQPGLERLRAGLSAEVTVRVADAGAGR